MQRGNIVTGPHCGCRLVSKQLQLRFRSRNGKAEPVEITETSCLAALRGYLPGWCFETFLSYMVLYTIR